jgi:hypothetical protein
VKARIAAILIAPIIGAILGILLAQAVNYGWLASKWQPIEKPPERVARLLAIQRDTLWIEGESTMLYTNENSSSCSYNCWVEVSEIPDESDEGGYVLSIKNEACGPLPPLTQVAATISECRMDDWRDFNHTFALRKDGNIFYWQASINREWTLLVLIYAAFYGAVGLFVPTLFIVLFGGLLDWLSNRATRRPS